MNSPEKQRGKLLYGKVVSVAMNKVAVIDIERSKTHRLYGKSYKVNHRIKARNEISGIEIGNMVYIRETRPRSSQVHFEIIKVEKE
jgi:small subunit ribosomal protein S17